MLAADAVEAPSVTRFASVLIPTDFSPLANRAIPVGYGLLARGGEIHLLHVVSDADREPVPELNQRLRGLVPEDAEALGIHTQTHVIVDDTASSGIQHAANRLATDAICMATHGRSAATELLLGSQAQDVLRRAKQPVLLVRAENG